MQQFEQFHNLLITEVGGGVRILNTTDKVITFKDVTGTGEVHCPPCGRIIQANIKEILLRRGPGGVDFVSPQMQTKEYDLLWLKAFQEENPDVVIVGTFPVAQAYHGIVCAMVPTRAKNGETSLGRKMNPHRFITYEKKEVKQVKVTVETITQDSRD